MLPILGVSTGIHPDRERRFVRSSRPVILRRLVIGLALATLATGCDAILGGELNPAYCRAHPTDADCRAKYPDAGTDTPMACQSSAECAPEVCDLASMTCAQCTPSEPAACSGTTPACVGTHCEACDSHAQCASNACLADGSCAPETNVAYVDPGGTNNTTCSKAMACTTVAKALATNRPFVRFAGTTDEGVTIQGGRVVTFLAAPGAKLTRGSGGAILTARDDGTAVTVYDLAISDAPNSASGIGVVIPTASGSPSVTLHHVTVANNPGGGISVSGGTLTVVQSTISGNSGGGITMSAAGVVVISNNFIHHNGNTLTASAGGVSIRPTGASKLEFNTVIDNQASLGALSAGGVSCDVGGFVAPHNIIFRNTGGPSNGVQTIGVCSYGDSYNMPGASASDNTPQFKSPNAQPVDYHLTGSSPPSIVGAAGACTGVDFDGESRPQGGACDLGADEYKP